MSTSLSSFCMGAFFYAVTVAILSGQTASSSQQIQQEGTASPVASAPVAPVSSTQSLIATYQAEQQSLAQEMQGLVDQGTTSEQIVAWQQKNASRFAAQVSRAQAMTVTSALQPVLSNVQPPVPNNASQTLKDFIATQSMLANVRAQIHNQLVKALAASASSTQINEMQAQEMDMFLQAHSGDLQVQAQRAQALASQSAPMQIPDPGPPVIPTGATPQMASFLTTRNQLLRSQIQLRNEYATATPAVQQAALEQWSQQNATLIQQMQQQAQSLGQTNTGN